MNTLKRIASASERIADALESGRQPQRYKAGNKSEVLAAVMRINERKLCAHREPSHALLNELRRELPECPVSRIREEISMLQAAGLVTTGPTINDTYISL